ncbi:MAG: flotillin family protein [Desulfobacterales bacterium]|nr:flotillin family protein [Desulfobacterales bacterium]
MTASSFIFTFLTVGLIAILIAWLIIWRFYKRTSKEMAFVRTGFRGQKVVITGGALVFPMLHETTPVKMNTLVLEVTRSNNQALITQDRMRVDIKANFYVRVKPTEEAVADAAQTLGRRTTDEKSLKGLLEGKLVDELRAAAAEMTMDELHDQRSEFVRKVYANTSEILVKNGLELESVSLTDFDQTDKSYFNAQNAFDAQGLSTLTRVIQDRMKQRNDIERDTEIAIKKKTLETERQKLELSREEEFAKLEQQKEIEVRRAEQQTTISNEQTQKEKQAREAQIIAKQQVEQAQLLAEKSIEEDRISKELYLKEKDIAKEGALERSQIERERQAREAQIAAKLKVDEAQMLVEKNLEEGQIAKELHLKEKDIERSKIIEVAEIDRQKSVALADQDRSVALAAKSKELSQARSEVEKARALEAKAEEQVITARQIEVSEREKAIELVEARKKAEREAINITQTAEARKKAAVAQAETVRIISKGEADKIMLITQAEVDAEVSKSKAAEIKYAVDAAGRHALHEADNILNPDKSADNIKMALINRMENIIRESVKPMEAIEGIKIIHVGGLTPGGYVSGNGNGDGNVTAGSGDNLADQVVNSALRYRGQAPLIDSLLKEVGITGSDINGLTGSIKVDDKKPTE